MTLREMATVRLEEAREILALDPSSRAAQERVDDAMAAVMRAESAAVETCSLCEALNTENGLTTIRVLAPGMPRIVCPQCKGTGKARE